MEFSELWRDQFFPRGALRSRRSQKQQSKKITAAVFVPKGHPKNIRTRSELARQLIEADDVELAQKTITYIRILIKFQEIARSPWRGILHRKRLRAAGKPPRQSHLQSEARSL